MSTNIPFFYLPDVPLEQPYSASDGLIIGNFFTYLPDVPLEQPYSASDGLIIGNFFPTSYSLGTTAVPEERIIGSRYKSTRVNVPEEHFVANWGI